MRPRRPRTPRYTRLVKALDKLDDYRPPIKVLPVVQDYFHKLATVDQNRPQAAGPAHTRWPTPTFEKQFVSVPHQNAMVRDTLTPTVLNAGYKTNIIPSNASAEIDCRLLPDEDPKAFIKVIRDLIGDDNIKIEQLLEFPDFGFARAERIDECDRHPGAAQG